MCGFGSPLMPYTSTSGVTVSLTGRSGNAKTGAMYAGLSIFGHPKDLSVVGATDNGLTGRYLGLHSIMFGLDEVGDKEAKDLGKFIHDVSQGKARLREPASGSLTTTQAVARDVSTGERLQVQLCWANNSNPPPRQIKRTQFGKSRIPKRFLISPSTSTPTSEEKTEEFTLCPQPK